MSKRYWLEYGIRTDRKALDLHERVWLPSNRAHVRDSIRTIRELRKRIADAQAELAALPE